MTSWKYTPEMTAWIRENSKGVEWNDLAPLFNEMFGCDKTARQLRSHAHDNEIHNGIWHDNPCGHNVTRPARPVGSKRLDKNGFVLVKIAEPNKWRREQFVIWEQYHEQIDIRKEMLIHLDGNRQNNAIENLYKIDRRLIGLINHAGLSRQITPETIKSIETVAKLKVGAVDIIQKKLKCGRAKARYIYNPERFSKNQKRHYEKINKKQRPC